ncbi:unnamed protein product [Moneuplotes crassus]|uniref:Uncharacterized protein n=1 Tax=Euplotes crassus TaxID=5936 RepID=A0AAD1U3Z4_EUPCR|nr:unnamed protein product [Moneuplotes crassus]
MMVKLPQCSCQRIFHKEDSLGFSILTYHLLASNIWPPQANCARELVLEEMAAQLYGKHAFA